MRSYRDSEARLGRILSVQNTLRDLTTPAATYIPKALRRRGHCFDVFFRKQTLTSLLLRYYQTESKTHLSGQTRLGPRARHLSSHTVSVRSLCGVALSHARYPLLHLQQPRPSWDKSLLDRFPDAKPRTCLLYVLDLVGNPIHLVKAQEIERYFGACVQGISTFMGRVISRGSRNMP